MGGRPSRADLAKSQSLACGLKSDKVIGRIIGELIAACRNTLKQCTRKAKVHDLMKNLFRVHKTVYIQAMNTTKDGIKAWLAKYPDRDRNWLAEQCEVEKRTVDNWLSSPQNIPSKAILIIESLMRSDAELEPATLTEIVNLPVACTSRQFDLYTQAFKHSECDHFKDWITSRLDDAADAEIGATAGNGLAALPNGHATETMRVS